MYSGQERYGRYRREVMFGLRAVPQEDLLRELISGVDCIVAMESASDLLDMSNYPIYNEDVTVYATKELNIPHVECIVVESFDNIDTVERCGFRVTSPVQTIIDMFRYDRDPSHIVEALADWYCSHNSSFDELPIPDDIREEFESYIEDAIDYYAH